MNHSETIRWWLDAKKESCIQYLQDLVRIPSVTGTEKEVQEFTDSYAKEMGLTTDKFEPDLEELKKHPAYVEVERGYSGRPNVVALWKGSGSGRSLILNGHVDVIPEGAPQNWQHGCWSADIADGKLYGRGASDMKSGVAAMTMAVRALKECGFHLKGDVILEYVIDEELSGNGTLACVMRGYTADAGICCETSGMCVQPASIGRIWYTIHVKGKATGIQQRFEGVNAIDKGYLVHKAIEKYEHRRLLTVTHPLYPDMISAIPCMVGQFESGTYNSAFPDTCTLKGSLATVPGESSDVLKKEFQKFLQQECARQDDWLAANPPEILYTGYFAEPSEIPADSPIVQTLCSNFRKYLNREPEISGREGAADIRHLNRYGNTPTVIFGPGSTEQMHANNEWVSVQDYLDSIAILANTILDWCGANEERGGKSC